MKAVHEMTEVPVMGQRYLVPCVEITADDIKGYCEGMLKGWWPVMGPEHEDARFFDFPHSHWHFDARFMSARQLRNRAHRSFLLGKIGQQEAVFVLTFPLTNHGNLRAPELRRKQCLRQMPEWERTLPALPKLERVLLAEGRTLKGNCKVCPHRGFPLASLPVAADGGVTCPGHGLRWHAETGKMLQRSAHQPVRSRLLNVCTNDRSEPYLGRDAHERKWACQRIYTKGRAP